MTFASPPTTKVGIRKVSAALPCGANGTTRNVGPPRIDARMIVRPTPSRGAADLELRVPVDQLLPLNECGEIRLVRDVEEDGGDADEKADGVQLPDRERAEPVGDRDRAEQQRPREVAGDEDRAPAQPV